MQGVIGQYESVGAAEAAVRNLELRGISIQNIIVADRQQRRWRRLSTNASARQGNVLVCLIDEPQNIERARALLATFPA
jgi:shikimate 5-dehydrogenase